MIEIDKLRNKSTSELKTLVLDERRRLATLTVKLQQGAEKDISQIKKIKKYIARILTVIGEMEVLKDAKKSP